MGKKIKSDKILWLYELRGIAIICVAIAHMQGRTHESEWIQIFCSYSLTALVFIMGYTKVLSFNHLFQSEAFQNARNRWSVINSKTLQDIFKFVPEYLLLCVVKYGSLYDLGQFLNDSLSFMGPEYFIKHFMILTALAPFIYAGVLAIAVKIGNKPLQVIAYAAYCALLFAIVLIPVNTYVQTYILVYALGMIARQTGFFEKKGRDVFYVPIFTVLCLIGFWGTQKEYYQWAAGNDTYAIGIDKLIPYIHQFPPNMFNTLFGISLCILMFELFKAINKIRIPGFKYVIGALVAFGKYSMDICLWHWIVRDRICDPLWMSWGLQNIWLKRVFYFGLMLGLPSICKYLVERFKKSSAALFAEPLSKENRKAA